MTLLRELDPQGVEQRRSRRLQRRIYFSKVRVYTSKIHTYTVYTPRVPTSSGTLMVMISCHSMAFVYMVVWMGTVITCCCVIMSIYTFQV